MQKHGVLPDDGIDWVFKNHHVIALDYDFLISKITGILIVRKHDTVFTQINGFPSFIPVTIIIQVLSLVVIETIFRVRPFTKLLLELVVSDFFADIVDYACEILVLFAQQTVLLDAPYVNIIA